MWELTAKGHEETFGVREKYMLLEVMLTEADTFVQTHQPVHLEGVHFIVYKLYVNKVDFFKKRNRIMRS